MFRRDPTSPPAHFSVHAEFTISHPGADDPKNRPRTSTERDEATGEVKMTYTWQPEWPEASDSVGAKQDTWTSASNSNKSIFSDTPSSTPAQLPKITPPSAMFNTDYTRGFQQGNIFFTSTPPPPEQHSSRDIPKEPRLAHPGLQGLLRDSSGYGSDLLSPNSQGGSPRRVVQPYDRKCRSTCNITLSTNLGGSPEPYINHSQCGRTQSLRCQTPFCIQKHPLRFYGCGDPWCHHLQQGEDFAASPCKISPVIEEQIPPSTKTPSRSKTYSPGDYISNKKDASVQTFEMVDKCTSPFQRMNSTDSVDGKTVRKYQRRGLTAPLNRKNYSPGGGSFTPDSLDSVKPPKRLVKSPKLRRMPAVDVDHITEPLKEIISSKQQNSDPNSKKPRTVHIDVYCTGTEMESSASDDECSDNGSKSASTPQTVFENEKMKINHRQAGERDIPFNLRPKIENTKSPLIQSLETNTSVEKEESDDDNASTAYPSKMSSYSNMGDFSNSVSSVPHSWTTYSMSSCAIPEDYDSVANTSWKDTFSDVESLLMSRSSIAPTESLVFVPRKRYETTQSIDETPEFSYNRKDILETPSNASIQPSDSFEYANSEDRVRIKHMEDLWRNKGSIKSPNTLQMQQKRIQEYMDRRINARSKWDSKDSDSNDSDDSGKAWTIVKNAHKEACLAKKVESKAKSPVNSLPNTVRDAFVKSVTPQILSPSSVKEFVPKNRPEPLKKPLAKDDQGSLSDSSPNRSPSSSSFKQRLSLDPNLRSPFMIVPGIYTEPRSIARKFGAVVSLMKKPGHHIGPAKNPDCLCDHCQSYRDSVGYRTRTRSVGEPPNGKYVQNWKEFLEEKGQKTTFSDT